MTQDTYQQAASFIETEKEAVIDVQSNLVRLKALGPDNDGPGEWDKADYLTAYLNDMGLSDIIFCNAPDDRADRGSRPNLAAILPGKNRSKTLWIVGHMDVVPAGDEQLWETDPFTLEVNGDELIGRGVEDNHQGIVMGLIALRAFLLNKLQPAINVGVLFVSDEETGSKYGLDYVLENHQNLFSKNDLFLVPDFGDESSGFVEVAEKSMLWLKVMVKGKQCHASVPDQGTNSLVAASALIMELQDIYDVFDKEDTLFHPATSTFEPTKKEANVPNVNTIPGKDIFYIDCRILPEYAIEEVVAYVRKKSTTIEKKYGVTIELENVLEEQAAPPTSIESEIVTRLFQGIQAVYGVQGEPVGMGGGTVAAFLRRRGYPAVVWSTQLHNAHQPNEKALISNILGDAKVIAHMACTP